MSKNVVLIINEPDLLKSISGIYTEKGFSVFPFLLFEEVPHSLFKLENLFVLESMGINPGNLQWIDFLKEKKTIKFILIDFLNDSFLVKMMNSNPNPREIYRMSYKVKDLIRMSEMVFEGECPFIRVNSYLKDSSLIYAKEIKEGNNYLETAERAIYDFLVENNLYNKIKDLDEFFFALGEVVENFVEYQMRVLKKNPDIILEYGLDNEKLIVSARDRLGAADFVPLFNSFIRKTSTDKNQNESVPDYNDKGIYVGKQGRGMSIVKHSVHRLISIVKKEADRSFEKRTQFIFIVYIDKKIREDNSSVNMLVFF